MVFRERYSFNFYGKACDDLIESHKTSSPPLLSCTQQSIEMEYGGHKNCVAELKIDSKKNLVTEESSTEAKLL